MTADAVIESSSTAVIPLRSYALAGANKAWAYVTNYSDHTNPSVGGKLTLSSPVSGSARFISTKDGSILGYQAVSAGSNTLNLPTFNTDIAVEITSASVPSPAETTPPSISFSLPASGATVSGTAVTVSATASDNIAVAGVRFMVDDYNIADEDISAPYSVSWSTQGIEDGSHTLTAVAYDTSGNTATTTRTVTVSNGSLTITNVSPSSGPVGTMVIITGTKLDMTSSLQFNQGGAVSYTIMSPTQIRATVPAGSQTGG